MKAFKIFVIATCSGVIPSLAGASCGSAFCTVNSNWTSESAMTEPGSTLDLRYEYINQNQPRAGNNNVAVGQIPHDHDEVSTTNRNILATYSHNFNSEWGVAVIAPIVDRNHFHNDADGASEERWKFTELGDVRVLGKYQLPYAGDPLKASTMGFTFGLKLPTGTTKVTNEDGEIAERSLQPGTGTTDAIIGAYYHQKLPHSNSSWFAQTQYQHALNSHDEFKPGSQFGVDVGYRHGITDKLGALVQANFVAKGRDGGAQAEPEDSGGRFVFVSPGLSYAVSDEVQIYGFIQKPLYQHVNGVQLTANKSFVVGVTGRF